MWSPKMEGPGLLYERKSSGGGSVSPITSCSVSMLILSRLPTSSWYER